MLDDGFDLFINQDHPVLVGDYEKIGSLFLPLFINVYIQIPVTNPVHYWILWVVTPPDSKPVP